MKKIVQSVKIDPSVVDTDDMEMLEDLVLSAVNAASQKVDEHDGSGNEQSNRRHEITGYVLRWQIP